MNGSSSNAVQNKAITAALTDKQNKLIAGDNVEITEDVISVITTNEADEDNTKPITSAGVNKIVGNIDALLETI